jgi:hypothetical protein
LSSIALLIGLTTVGSTYAQTVTIEADSPTVHNCYPFGGGGNPWPPYSGFVYQNVPAFSLGTGDVLAFDLGAPNDVAIELTIDMVATTSNGGDIPVGAFTEMVSNTQTPTNPFGDGVIGNYELQFSAESDFDFPGGGLIIRFSSPSVAYAADSSCTQVLVSAASTDSSGYFVSRIYRDSDGVPPWNVLDDGAIGGFQVGATGITTATPTVPIPTLSAYGIAIMMMGLLLLAGRRLLGSTKQ